MEKTSTYTHYDWTKIEKIIWRPENLLLSEKKLVDRYKDRESEILEEININLVRVQSFIEDNGFIFPENIIFLRQKDEEDLKKIDDTLIQQLFLSKTFWYYDYSLDKSIIFVDNIKEWITNLVEWWVKQMDIVIESMVVHEIIHSNSWIEKEILLLTKKWESYTKSRSWFSLYNVLNNNKKWPYFEEWIARMYESQYRSLHYDTSIHDLINKQRNRLQNEDPNWNANLFSNGDFILWEDQMFTHRLYLSGAWFELLMNDDEELKKTVLAYRKWDTNALAKLVQIIGRYRLDNGTRLYSKLTNLEYDVDGEDFEKGYHLMIEAIANKKNGIYGKRNSRTTQKDTSKDTKNSKKQENWKIYTFRNTTIEKLKNILDFGK